MSQTFPDLERARASGLLAFGMYIGTAVGPLITGQLLGYFSWPGATGWRVCMVLFALPGLLWSLVFLQVIPPRDLPATATVADKVAPLHWTALLTSTPLLLLFSQQFLRAGAMVFFVTWFPLYLQETRGVDVVASGLLAFFVALGGMVGSLLGGFASDALLTYTSNRRLSRQGIAVVGTGACALLAASSYFIADERLAIGVISLGTFCATFGGVSAYTMAIELGGKQVTTVFGTMNMCGNIGAMIFPVAVGWLVSGSGGNWHLALFLFAGIMALAATLWAVLEAPVPLAGEKHGAR